MPEADIVELARQERERLNKNPPNGYFQQLIVK